MKIIILAIAVIFAACEKESKSSMYMASISQTGIAAPVATVQPSQNTIGPIIWKRLVPGVYYGVLKGKFPEGKTNCTITQSETGVLSIYRVDNDNVTIVAKDFKGNLIDDLLNNNKVEIRINP